MEHLNIKIKRVYSAPAVDDGKRILVDRLWPRGLTKAKAKVDLWLKDVAPSNDLRKWFAHDPLKWSEFKKKYAEELANCPDALIALQEESKHGQITLLYGAKDEWHNEAVVLLALLQKR